MKLSLLTNNLQKARRILYVLQVKKQRLQQTQNQDLDSSLDLDIEYVEYIISKLELFFNKNEKKLLFVKSFFNKDNHSYQQSILLLKDKDVENIFKYLTIFIDEVDFLLKFSLENEQDQSFLKRSNLWLTVYNFISNIFLCIYKFILSFFQELHYKNSVNGISYFGQNQEDSGVPELLSRKDISLIITPGFGRIINAEGNNSLDLTNT